LVVLETPCEMCVPVSVRTMRHGYEEVGSVYLEKLEVEDIAYRLLLVSPDQTEGGM